MLWTEGKFCIRTAAVLLLFAFCLNLGVHAAHRTILQQEIAQEVLRVHVVANSDRREDQQVKYLVRDAVLAWMQETGGRELRTETPGEKLQGGAAVQTDAQTDAQTEVQAYLAAHLSDIEAIANGILSENGRSYQARASLARTYFPDRVYGECTFPAGWYDALRITLGKGAGQNWWGILYPELCFSDCIRGVTQEGDQVEDLKDVLSAQEYESLFRQPEKWKLSLWWFPLPFLSEQKKR